MRLTNFWETLDQLADTSLPEVDWRGGHQKEWPFIKPLLKATGKTASSISCPSPSGPNCPRRVVELDDGRLVAECQDTPAVCKRLDLTAQCVAISKLDRGKFAAMVCKALGLAVVPGKIGPNGVFHVGDRQVAAGRGVPVFALFQGGSQPEKSVVALEALESFASPRLLLVPTSQTLSSDQKTCLGRNGTTHMAFDDAIFCDDAHVAQASPAITQILGRLVTEVSQTLQATPAALVWQMPADARWGEVKIAFISDEVINVAFRGETRRFEPSQLGMTNAKNGKPTDQWTMLKAIAMGRGSIPFPAAAKIQKQKQSLSKKLTSAFGIQDDPIVAKAQAYQAGYVTNADGLTQGKQGASKTKFR
jgi:hypothetical protein